MYNYFLKIIDLFIIEPRLVLLITIKKITLSRLMCSESKVTEIWT